MKDAPTPPPIRVTLTIQETALALGISPRTVRSILPELPYFRVGQRILVPVDELQAWARERVRAHKQADERLASEILKAMDP